MDNNSHHAAAEEDNSNNSKQDSSSSSSAALYQLIGPIESLYQLVPFGMAHNTDANANDGGSSAIPLPFQQHFNEPENGGSNSLVLFPISLHAPPTPPPYLDNDLLAGGYDHDYAEILEEMAAASTSVEAEEFGRQWALVPVGGFDYQLELFDEEYYQLAPPNQLNAPIQLLAIEGPPQFQLVGPVPQLARIRCRFANGTPRELDLVWTDDSNRMYRYAKLAHEEFVDITTFEGHQWIFCDALDGELYLTQPGLVKKFVANALGAPRGRRQHISAVHNVNDLSLRKIALRVLAQKLFHAWDRAAGDQCSRDGNGSTFPSVGPLIQSMRMPLFIQVQLAQFVLSCLLYQMKFEYSQHQPPLSRAQQQIFQWLLQFVRSH